MALHRRIDDEGDRNEVDVNPLYVQLARERVPRRTMPQSGMLPDTALSVPPLDVPEAGRVPKRLCVFA